MSDMQNMGGGTDSNPDMTTPIQMGQMGSAVPAASVPADAAESGGASGGASAEAPAPAAATAEADFPQHYSLLFCCVSLFIAAMWLPIEGNVLDLYAKDSISGGFLTIFAAYGVFASWMNIHNRKMIVWPVFFAACDGIYIAVKRGFDLAKPASERTDMVFRDWVRVFGPGYYVIAICSLLVLWTLLTAVLDGHKKEQARKEAAKASRGKK